ncbi:unnamed protein product [Camellia sinensis]
MVLIATVRSVCFTPVFGSENVFLLLRKSTSYASYSHHFLLTSQKDKNIDLSAKIEEGFGPNGLGILSISDLLACLPEDVKKELEDPNSRYNFGWSHGKEKLESGKPA